MHIQPEQGLDRPLDASTSTSPEEEGALQRTEQEAARGVVCWELRGKEEIKHQRRSWFYPRLGFQHSGITD